MTLPFAHPSKQSVFLGCAASVAAALLAVAVERVQVVTDRMTGAGQVEQPVDELYNDAMNTAFSGNPIQAAPKFEEVERQHPYSTWAVASQRWPPGRFMKQMIMRRQKPALNGSFSCIRQIH